MNTCQWLDKVRKEYQLDSDYKLAKLLGIRANRISTYRHTHIGMGEELALKVEDLLSLPPGTVLLQIQAERTKSPEAAKILRSISKQIGSAAAALIITLSMLYAIVSPTNAIACPASFDCNTVYYVKLIIVWICTAYGGKVAFCLLFFVNRFIIHYFFKFWHIARVSRLFTKGRKK